MKTKHTPEPWEVKSEIGIEYIFSERHGAVATIPHGGKAREEHQANAARIVACVNACAGMQDPAAEIAALRKRIAELEAQPKKPHPNWDEAPEWAMWWAVDENGNAWWYEEEPPASDYQWLLVCGSVLADAGSVNLNGFYWKQTLTKRP